jgi:membrane-bound inhibitor of C-type lysozyme
MWPRILIVAVLLVLAAAVGRWLMGNDSPAGAGTETARHRIAAATFACDGGKTITATFYASASRPATGKGGPPEPGGSVHLELSDGRALDLPQTISASGARYADAAESVVFWNRGNGAFIVERAEGSDAGPRGAGAEGDSGAEAGDRTEASAEADGRTYAGCIAVAPDPGGLPGVYESGADGFSIRYPQGYDVEPDYEYQALGPGKAIPGVKLTIDPSIAAGTNLGADSYLSVEHMPRGESGTASRFLGSDAAATAVTDGGTTYSVARSTGAGAGNRYEESVFALLGSDPCIAVRYFIHSSVLENYPPGAVRAFDRRGLITQFDAIRRTLIVAR